VGGAETPESGAQLIFDHGPLTRAEIKKLSQAKAFEYLELMKAFLDEMGREAFLARREELREAVLRKIVNRP
jgi:hypothetical protein